MWSDHSSKKNADTNKWTFQSSYDTDWKGVNLPVPFLFSLLSVSAERAGTVPVTSPGLYILPRTQQMLAKRRNEYKLSQAEQYNKGSYHLLRGGSLLGAKCFMHINHVIESSNSPCEVGTLKWILLAILLVILFFCLVNRSTLLERFASPASLAARVAAWPHVANEMQAQVHWVGLPGYPLFSS